MTYLREMYFAFFQQKWAFYLYTCTYLCYFLFSGVFIFLCVNSFQAFPLQNYQAVDFDLVLFTFLLLTRRLSWGIFQEVSTVSLLPPL